MISNFRIVWVHRNCVGAIGEDLVLEKFIKKGGILLGKNVYSRFGEIDLIILLNCTIYVIEVKTTEVNYNNVSLVTEQKVQKLYKTFEIFTDKLPLTFSEVQNFQFLFYRVDLRTNVRFKRYFF